MEYRVIEDYYRRQVFDRFRGYRDPFYSVSFRLKFSRMKEFLAERGYRTYLNLCYFFARATQPIEDFRVRFQEKELVLFEEIHLALTVPAANGTFSYVWYDYDPDVARFNANVELPDPNSPPTLVGPADLNYIYFTAIPGIPFTSFTHATDDPSDGAPRVAFGKPYEELGELWIPVGLQVNHAYVDGRPLGELYDRCEEVFADPH